MTTEEDLLYFDKHNQEFKRKNLIHQPGTSFCLTSSVEESIPKSGLSRLPIGVRVGDLMYSMGGELVGDDMTYVELYGIISELERSSGDKKIMQVLKYVFGLE
jgi:hypothetical protein